MEKFFGTGHIPGAPKIWDVNLTADWEKKQFLVDIPDTGAKVSEWPGLMVQTIDSEEAVFRTRGIPPLQIHWWHVVKNSNGDVWVMVLALPNEKGIWLECGLLMKKTS